jgi:hypothetical protein
MIAICAGLPATARAAEEPPVVKALLDGAGLNAAARPTYQSLEVAADGTITLKGLSMAYKGGDDPAGAMEYQVETVTLSEVKEESSGLFEIGKANWSGLTIEVGGTPVVSIPLITGRSVYVFKPSSPPTTLEKMRASNLLGKEIAMPAGTVQINGSTLTLQEVRWNWDGDPLTGAGTSEFDVGRILLPAALMKDEEGGNPLAEAGYGDLEFTVGGKGATTLTEEAWGFDFEMRFKGNDIGTLVVDLAADNFPMALFSALNASEPQMGTLMPLVQAITLKRAKVRFEDGSLTGRILAMMAQAQGMDERSFIASTTEGLKASLAEFKDHKLAGQAISAVSAFLADPKAFTVSINPPQPVRVDQLMAAGEDPTAIIDKLSVSISAND